MVNRRFTPPRINDAVYYPNPYDSVYDPNPYDSVYDQNPHNPIYDQYSHSIVYPQYIHGTVYYHYLSVPVYNLSRHNTDTTQPPSVPVNNQPPSVPVNNQPPSVPVNNQPTSGPVNNQPLYGPDDHKLNLHTTCSATSYDRVPSQPQYQVSYGSSSAKPRHWASKVISGQPSTQVSEAYSRQSSTRVSEAYSGQFSTQVSDAYSRQFSSRVSEANSGQPSTQTSEADQQNFQVLKAVSKPTKLYDTEFKFEWEMKNLSKFCFTQSCLAYMESPVFCIPILKDLCKCWFLRFTPKSRHQVYSSFRCKLGRCADPGQNHRPCSFRCSIQITMHPYTEVSSQTQEVHLERDERWVPFDNFPNNLDFSSTLSKDSLKVTCIIWTLPWVRSRDPKIHYLAEQPSSFYVEDFLNVTSDDDFGRRRNGGVPRWRPFHSAAHTQLDVLKRTVKWRIEKFDKWNGFSKKLRVDSSLMEGCSFVIILYQTLGADQKRNLMVDIQIGDDDPDTIARFSNDPDTIARFSNDPDTIARFSNDPDTIARFSNDPDTIARFSNDPDTIARVRDDPDSIVTVQCQIKHVVGEPKTIGEASHCFHKKDRGPLTVPTTMDYGSWETESTDKALTLQFEISISRGNSECLRHLNQVQDYKNSDLVRDFKNDMLQFYKKKEFCDIILESTDGQKFFCNRDILSARGKFWKPEDENLDPVRVDVDGETLDRLLTFVYSGVLEKMEIGCLISIYIAAFKYEVPSLMIFCRRELQWLITPETAGDIHTAAHTCNDTTLRLLKNSFRGSITSSQEN